MGWGGEFEPELSSLPSGVHLFYEKKSDHQIRHNFGPLGVEFERSNLQKF